MPTRPQRDGFIPVTLQFLKNGRSQSIRTHLLALPCVGDTIVVQDKDGRKKAVRKVAAVWHRTGYYDDSGGFHEPSVDIALENRGSKK